MKPKKTKKPKISVVFRYSHYHINKDSYCIQAKLYPDHTITLQTTRKDSEFILKRSEPEAIKTIGELLIEASKL